MAVAVASLGKYTIVSATNKKKKERPKPNKYTHIINTERTLKMRAVSELQQNTRPKFTPRDKSYPFHFPWRYEGYPCYFSFNYLRKITFISPPQGRALRCSQDSQVGSSLHGDCNGRDSAVEEGELPLSLVSPDILVFRPSMGSVGYWIPSHCPHTGVFDLPPMSALWLPSACQLWPLYFSKKY